jgi:two-component system KDP operon response regulator KdpE
VYVNRLRHKLEADPRSPRLILSESGLGYRLWGGD